MQVQQLPRDTNKHAEHLLSQEFSKVPENYECMTQNKYFKIYCLTEFTLQEEYDKIRKCHPTHNMVERNA